MKGKEIEREKGEREGKTERKGKREKQRGGGRNRGKRERKREINFDEWKKANRDRTRNRFEEDRE